MNICLQCLQLMQAILSAREHRQLLTRHSSRCLNTLAAVIASSKTASTYYDSEHITQIKMIAFAYIATL